MKNGACSCSCTGPGADIIEASTAGCIGLDAPRSSGSESCLIITHSPATSKHLMILRPPSKHIFRRRPRVGLASALTPQENPSRKCPAKQSVEPSVIRIRSLLLKLPGSQKLEDTREHERASMQLSNGAWCPAGSTGKAFLPARSASPHSSRKQRETLCCKHPEVGPRAIHGYCPRGILSKELAT